MAAVIASTVTEKLTSMLADTILQEVSLVTGFKEDFEFLCDQVGSIEGLLNELAERRNSRSMSIWIENLEDFVEDAMDIVEECRVASIPLFSYCKFGNPILRYRVSHKIKKLKERIRKIHADAKYLKYITFASILDVNARVLSDSEDQREKSTSLIRESQIVGMEEDMKEINERLLKEEGPEVIAVVGMGGQGKTLLAQRLFKFHSDRQIFDHKVWISVSQKFFAKRLLLDAIKQIKPDAGKQMKLDEKKIKLDGKKKKEEEKTKVDQMNLEDLRQEISERLKEKSLLIVLDDVWNIDVFDEIFWAEWPCKKKIIITTRDKKVVEHMPNHYIHPMNTLEDDMSLKLFCIHAFPDIKEQTPPPELACIAKRIVEKCSRLPLALKTVGVYMATVRSLPNDWQRTLDHLNEAAPISGKVMPSLRLSYEALPNHLKACFVYCSVFPKNTPIYSEYLVYAWIAQEFVSTQVPAEAYDLGRSYLDQLIDRCLMEVSYVGWDGRVENCKMHDLLHDLALSESLRQTKCLLNTGEDIKKLPVEKCRGSRRISLMKNDISTIEEDIQCPGLRTLMLFNNQNLRSISPNFFNNLRYLTVLDVGATSINSLPESVGNLKHLKFLNLYRTQIDILPEWLSGLRRLQFLDVSHCHNLKRLHSGIGKSQFMLHLNTEWSSKIELLPVGISQLTSLQTLHGVVVGREISGDNANALKLTDLKGLRLLQQLSLTIAKVDDALSSSSKGIQFEEGILGIQLEEGIFGGMTNMRTIRFINNNKKRFLSLPTDMNVMQGLEIICLGRCVVPKWIFDLQNLMELVLDYAHRCSADDYKGLASIPHLKKIELWDNDQCIEFPNEFGGPRAFQKLEWFTVQYFQGLRKFPSLQDNAMPMLKHFEFFWCDHMKSMPEGLERLKSLQEVVVQISLDDPQEAEELRKAGCWKILKERQIKINLLIKEPKKEKDKKKREKRAQKDEENQSGLDAQHGISRYINVE